MDSRFLNIGSADFCRKLRAAIIFQHLKTLGQMSMDWEELRPGKQAQSRSPPDSNVGLKSPARKGVPVRFRLRAP